MLNKEDIINIYKLEYFLHLSQEAGIRELANLFADELENYLQMAIYSVRQVFEGWKKYNDIYYGDLDNPQEFQDTVEALHAGGVPNPEEHAKSLQQTTERIDRVIDTLRNPPSNLKDRLVLIQRAITTMHNSGSMLDYINDRIKDDTQHITKDLLDEIGSDKSKYVEKWNREFSRMMRAAELRGVMQKVAGLANTLDRAGEYELAEELDAILLALAAEYKGKKVKLNDPIRNPSGSKKKFRVYVRDPKTKNVKKVEFGDPKMEIKRDDPDRRKSFRARHKCDQNKDKTTPGYWSCYQWRKNKKVDN